MHHACTCAVLRKLTRTVTRLYDSHLAEFGMKTTQYSLLRTIAQEPLPMAELARRLSTERTTLTRNLRPLIDAGWVGLEPGADARQRIVVITPSGRDAIAAARAAWRRAQTALEATLGRANVEELQRNAEQALATLTPLVERTPDVVEP